MATRPRITDPTLADMLSPGRMPSIGGGKHGVPTGGALHIVKVSNRHDFVISVDAIAPNEVLFDYAAPTAFRTLIAFAGSQSNARVPATSTYALSVRKNGVEVGTITFEPGATDATLASLAEVEFGVGDLLSIVAPASMDATLAGVAITLVAQRIG